MNHNGPSELPETWFALATSLRPRLLSAIGQCRNGRCVVGIGGESGAGKSVTANCLAVELSGSGIPTTVIHQDDYFRLPPRANHEQRRRDIRNVGPLEVDLDLLRSHVDAFRAGRDNVTAPLVDYNSDSFVTQCIDFSHTAVLIAEGTYVLFLDNVDFRIFLRATHGETHERRRERNRDIDEPFVQDVLAIEHGIIAPQVRLADIVVDPDFAIEPRPAG